MQEGALVEAVAGVEVEGEVEEGCCQGYAGELGGWEVSGWIGLGGGLMWDRTKPVVKPMVVA